jgi:hypothetical protein
MHTRAIHCRWDARHRESLLREGRSGTRAKPAPVARWRCAVFLPRTPCTEVGYAANQCVWTWLQQNQWRWSKSCGTAKPP